MKRKQNRTVERALRHACCGAVLPILFVLSGCGGGGASGELETWTMKPMDLEIVVEKGGTVAAAENVEVRCKVMGQSRIIYLIPEGTQVKEGDTLVKLDSSDLEDNLTKQEIAYQTALANKIQAEEMLEIQKSQNESNIAQAKLQLEFAIMDFKKYTGFVGDLPGFSEALKADLNPKETNGFGEDPKKKTGRDLPGTADAKPAVAPAKSPEIQMDFETFFEKSLDAYTFGDAAQLWRQQDSNLKLAKSKFKIAEYNKEGSEELFKKDFISKTKRDADVLDFDTSKINQTKAEEDLRLLQMFTHPMNLKQYISDLNEKLLELDRVRRKARAELSKAVADLRSMEAKFENEQRLKDKLEMQVVNCTIKAETPGLVVYARPRSRYRSEDLIEEGTQVYERQQLISLPNLSKLVVDLQVHESKISLVKAGQQADVTFESLQGETLRGTVQRVAILPDNVHRFMNPNLKVYNVKVAIDESNGLDLKPGLTAAVKIYVDRVPNVLCAPIQAVVVRGSYRFVQVAEGGERGRREVKVGKYNDMYVEIKSGLKAGERILMTPKIEEIKEDGEDGEGDEKKGADESRFKPVDNVPGGGPSSGGPAAGQGRSRQGGSRPAGMSGSRGSGERERSGGGMSRPSGGGGRSGRSGGGRSPRGNPSS